MNHKEMIKEICDEDLFLKIKSQYNLTDTETKWLISKVFEYFKSEVIEKEFNEEKLSAKGEWEEEKRSSEGKYIPPFSEYFKIEYSYPPTFEGYFICYLVDLKEYFEKEILEYIDISDYFVEDDDDEDDFDDDYSMEDYLEDADY